MVLEAFQIQGSNQAIALSMFPSMVSNHQLMKYSVPQGSVLEPSIDLIFINVLNFAIKNSASFHFTDDTCLFNVKQSIKENYKSLNNNSKSLLHWLSANETSINVTKTEVVIFRTNDKGFGTDLKLKMCGERLYPSHHV